MNILALTGSYRKRGNSARIVELVEAHMTALAARHEVPLTFETLHLGDLDIGMCRGCRSCFDRGEAACPLKDDVPAVKTKLDAADGFILASPVYINDVSGLIKTWLDRLAYICHRPAFAGKCAYLVATVADSPTNHTLRTMNVALRTWGCHIVGQAGYKMGALMPQVELERRYRAGTAQVAETLFQAVAQRQFLRPSFLSLMIFKIQQQSWQVKAERGTLDYTYWENQGWFDPGCTFYIEHRANPVKVALARGAGAVFARLMA